MITATPASTPATTTMGVTRSRGHSPGGRPRRFGDVEARDVPVPLAVVADVVAHHRGQQVQPAGARTARGTGRWNCSARSKWDQAWETRRACTRWQARRDCSSYSAASEQESAIIFNDLMVRVRSGLGASAAGAGFSVPLVPVGPMGSIAAT